MTIYKLSRALLYNTEVFDDKKNHLEYLVLKYK